MNDIKVLNRAADNIRVLALSMVEKAKSGHPGGAMGGADFINVLYSEYLRFDPDCPHRYARDRFYLDPGHMSPMLYAQLALTGHFSLAELQAFRQWGSPTPGHPERDLTRGIENTSGPLGQGHTFAVGAAIAAKFLAQRFGADVMPQRIYAYISDGGIQEEIAQGAGRTAGHLGLDNLTMFYDANDVQLSTMVDEVTTEDIAQKYKAWGWHVVTINGNDVAEIRKALDEAIATKGCPTLIIGKTVMAYKALNAEGAEIADRIPTHGQPLSKAGVSVEATLGAMGFDAQNPFAIDEKVAMLYQKRREELRTEWKAYDERFNAWAGKNAEEAETFTNWFEGKMPFIDWSAIEQKSHQPTRSASATVLKELVAKVPNMIVSSADLSNSDKTDGFLKGTKAISKEDFSGRFLQAGVSELTMAAVCLGMMLHGGVVAACGTFFVFSDYQKPVIRMAALMEIPLKFVWTHDAFRVGEDGPTHEPVEQEAQLRLMEKLHNHSGQRSMLVLRPADVHETTVAWQMAMENHETPTGLILSRQNIDDLPNDGLTPYARAARIMCGGYIVSDDEHPDIVLLATGSEVSTLEAAATILRAEGKKLRVVSIPSEGLFMDQPESYRKEVLPEGVKRFGLTAGLPVNLANLVGGNGSIHGLESFGYSAPYTVLDEQLGFTPELVAEKIRSLLK